MCETVCVLVLDQRTQLRNGPCAFQSATMLVNEDSRKAKVASGWPESDNYEDKSDPPVTQCSIKSEANHICSICYLYICLLIKNAVKSYEWLTFYLNYIYQDSTEGSSIHLFLFLFFKSLVVTLFLVLLGWI